MKKVIENYGGLFIFYILILLCLLLFISPLNHINASSSNISVNVNK